ncbi:MAG TPA: nitroreductase/quinone reductase family protein [Solirubrobacteraceae bacterium]|nr:nitroreductase/quinone reductase family protein [Solirubrobacteraceae bacterium]
MSALAIPPIDPRIRRGGLQEFLTRVALSKPGTWFYSEVAARVDPWLVRASRGRVSSAAGMLPIVLLTARGARSGVERTVPLVYFTDGDDVILMASSFGRPRYPSWYHNLKANPEATLEAMGRSARFRAAETAGKDRARLYELAKQLYTGYGDYEERTAGVREVPVMRLTQL